MDVVGRGWLDVDELDELGLTFYLDMRIIMLYVCSLCTKRADECDFHSIRYGYEMCSKCWEKRIKDTWELSKQFDPKTGRRIK